MNRHEHMAWCKQRALQILDEGDLTGAYASMVSDLTKHTETKNHLAIELGMQLMMNNHLATESDMRHFIEGFN